jgi:protein-L-isoaspartate(D-aspartate) O-methyltransferase
MPVDIELARYNMIEQQVRPWDVLAPRVLEALRAVPRERFVPATHAALAFADVFLPLGHGEVMLPPRLEARLIQALDLTSNDRILEVGTGSGYMTALLAHLGDGVDSVEIHADFIESARARLSIQGLAGKVRLAQGDAAGGWAGGPWDAILFTGSMPAFPASFRNLLVPGGRLVAVVGSEPVMEAVRVTRFGMDEFREETLFDTVIPPLRHTETEQRFVF